MRRIAVFCGSRHGTDPAYSDTARSFGQLLLERGLGLVYGGGDVGLMGVIADTVLDSGGEVIGVIPQHLVDREVAHGRLSELHVVESMHDRKALIYRLADAVVALPGGIGTFEELFEALTWNQLGLHHKPCGLLNSAGYYDPLVAMVGQAEEKGFVVAPDRLLVVEPDGARLLDRLGERMTDGKRRPGRETMPRKDDLLAALQEGDAQRVAELLAGDPFLAEARDENGVSLLLRAAYLRQDEAAERLLAARTALDVFEAAAFGRTERLTQLLDEDPERARSVSPDGFTPLHLAAFFRRVAAARLLIERGAEIGAASSHSMRVRPLHSAAASRDREMTALLLEHGAPVDAAQHGGWTALHSAARHGDREMVEKLLAHGADPARAADDGQTAADLAAAEGHGDLAAFLRGARS